MPVLDLSNIMFGHMCLNAPIFCDKKPTIHYYTEDTNSYYTRFVRKVYSILQDSHVVLQCDPGHPGHPEATDLADLADLAQ